MAQRKPIARFAAGVLFVLWCVEPGSAQADSVEICNTAGLKVGILIDGQDASGEVNDRGVITSLPVLEVGSLCLSPVSNEVAAFTVGRPPALTPTPWTSGNDSFTVTFGNLILVPVTVWIVKGPFAQQRDRAIEAGARTVIIWTAERMGVAFSAFDIVDATTDPQAPAHCAFPNGDLGDVVWKPLRDDIGFVPGRLNIYWVGTVNGSPTTGWSNFGAQIAMGSLTGDELLSHEIGHAFSLTHTDGDANFNVDNVMASASNTRQFLTEGQLFRSHLNPGTILNAVYNARPGQPTRNCGFSDASAQCPLIYRRLWADGTFPPN